MWNDKRDKLSNKSVILVWRKHVILTAARAATMIESAETDETSGVLFIMELILVVGSVTICFFSLFAVLIV